MLVCSNRASVPYFFSSPAPNSILGSVQVGHKGSTCRRTGKEVSWRPPHGTTAYVMQPFFQWNLSRLQPLLGRSWCILLSCFECKNRHCLCLRAPLKQCCWHSTISRVRNVTDNNQEYSVFRQASWRWRCVDYGKLKGKRPTFIQGQILFHVSHTVSDRATQL